MFLLERGANAERAASSARRSAVSSRPPAGAGPFGAEEQAGNVFEWCRDWSGDYPDKAVSDPLGPHEGAVRVIRGGSWDDGPVWARSACRDRVHPDGRFGSLGFRVLLPAP